MSAIIKFYITQIKLGKITIDDVPEKYREDVIASGVDIK